MSAWKAASVGIVAALVGAAFGAILFGLAGSRSFYPGALAWPAAGYFGAGIGAFVAGAVLAVIHELDELADQADGFPADHPGNTVLLAAPGIALAVVLWEACVASMVR